MSRSAHVTSIEAVAEFKAATQQFEADVRDGLMTLQLESQRAIDWIENDRATYWLHQVRKAAERVNEARNNLERAQLSIRADGKPSCYHEKKELALAQKRLRYAEEKVQNVCRWRRRLQHEEDEFHGKMGRMSQIIDVDLLRALAALDRIVEALERYSDRNAAPRQAKEES